MKNIFQKKKKIIHQNKTGFTIIEVLIACVIISVTTLALMSSATKGIELSNKALRQVQADMILEEGVEAVKSIRDTNWTTISNLTLNTNYYLSFSANAWTLSTTPSLLLDEIFNRIIVLSPVYRDSNDDIASSGTIDTGIKRVGVTVSWPSPSGVSSKNITFYIANIFN